jgi:transcriptional regulator with XRE-family HTH domain
VADLAADERESLIERTEQVEEELESSAAAEATVGDGTAERAELRRRWLRGVDDAVLDLVNVLPAGMEDYEARALLQFLTELRHAIDDDDKVRDERGRVKLARLKMLDVVHRLKRRLQHQILDVPEDAARFIFASLPGIGVTELAELLGVSTKTVGAWRHGKPVKSKIERVTEIAHLLAYLRGSMTARGLMLWFGAKHDALDDRTPLEILDRGQKEDVLTLLAYARGGRGQLAD